MAHLDLTDQNFDQEVIQSKGLTLVDFWAAWCGPCRMLAPTIDELTSEYNGKIKIAKVDVDANQSTAAKFNILSIPTVIIFKDGQPVSQMAGVQPKEKYTEEINKLLDKK
jgi:thioredoxin 1